MVHLPTLCLILLPGCETAPEDPPLPSPEGVRVEYFVIESAPPVASPPAATESGAGSGAESAAGPRAPAGAEPVGLVLISSTPSPDGTIREREVRFREGPVHLREVETEGPGRPQSIWRERGATWGRSWLAIWDAGLGALETTQWGPTKKVHGHVPLPERPMMPLELLALCRERWLDGEGFDCLDPLAGGVAFLEVAMRDLAADEVALLLDELGVERDAAEGAGGAARLVEWRRCDGSLAGRYLVRDGALLGFQWQEGSSWARRVEQRDYEEAAASWFSPVPDRTEILEAALERLRQKSVQGTASGARKASARIR